MANREGNPKFEHIQNKDTKAANQARSRKADDFALEVGRLLNEQQSRGLRKADLATLLNKEGVKTARGGMWTERSVRRIFARLEQLQSRSRKLN